MNNVSTRAGMSGLIGALELGGHLEGRDDSVLEMAGPPPIYPAPLRAGCVHNG